MAMERPAWTICFLLIWLTVIPGIIMTHMAVGKLIPEIADLPDNIVTGFEQVFKFAYLEQDSAAVKKEATDGVAACGNDAAVVCPGKTYDVVALGAAGKEMNPTDAKKAIQAVFQRSLGVVTKVANDKYFGTDDLKNTADSLTNIVKELDQLPEENTPCAGVVPTFCEIYANSDGIIQGMAEVDKAIDAFKNNDAIKKFEERKSLLTMLHAIPYFLVIALLFFTLFWFRGGVCCCCREGTKSGIALIPFVLFWLVGFLIYFIVLVLGCTVKYAADRYTVPALKGNPTFEQAIDHIQTNYPEFWNTVFAGFVDGLDLLFKSSFFFVAVALTVIVYSSCECCCMPYRKKDEQASG